MRKFINYFRDFHKEYYSTKLYATVLAFIAVLIALNYSLNVENGFIDLYYGRPHRIALYFAIHAIAYYGVLLIIYLFKPFKVNWLFWVKSIVGFLILAVDRSIFPNLCKWLLVDVPFETYRFYSKILVNSYGLVAIAGALAVMQFIFDRKVKEGLYGLRMKNVDFRAYFVMLLIMVPLVYAASWLPGFISYYPCYKRAGGAMFAEFYGFSEAVSKLIYEFFYVTDFLNTELFFRGFLVIGLSRLLGKNVVLPMAATYVVLHFGKPLGETISSAFGGYILGVIALYSRNIWGGVFVHGGIAFLMEVFAFLRM